MNGLADGGATGLRVRGAGAVLRLIRTGRASTRADLVDLTGMARSTVSQRLDALVRQGLLVPAGESASTGGRPPTAFAFNRSAGVVLATDLGATHARVAVTNLGGEVLAEAAEDLSIADGPKRVLSRVEELFRDLLREAGLSPQQVRGVGMGVPGTVEFATGRPVNPIMPGWDGYPVVAHLVDSLRVPALIDNDVNIMALGEYWRSWRDVEHLLFVKVGTGIGSGIVAGGRIHRGEQGAAGDIGHIYMPAHPDVRCRCGNFGCLEAVASGGAMAARLTELGIPTADGRDVVARVREGVPEALSLMRDAGRELGSVLAGLVNFFNPGVIVIGGDLAQHEQLVAGAREVIYQRSLPLPTRSLRVARSTLEDRAGITGAAVMIIEHVLSPDAVDHAIAAARGDW